MTPRITIAVTIRAEVDQVWTALRDPAQVRRWHGWNCDSLDAEVEMIYRSPESVEDAANHTLTLMELDTFQLTGEDGAVTVTLTRRDPDPESQWADWFDDITEGWQTFLQQLRFALERHPGEDRRTIYVAGEPAAGEPILPALPDVEESYAATLPTGDQLTGTVWFRSENQVGVTAREFGDGLLIVGRSPVTANRPEAGEMAVLTTYGLDDNAFAAMTDRVARWWKARHPGADAPSI